MCRHAKRYQRTLVDMLSYFKKGLDSVTRPYHVRSPVRGVLKYRGSTIGGVIR